jgi:hypothetical protein
MKTLSIVFAITSCLLFASLPVHAQWSAPVDISPAAISAGLNESMGSCIGTAGDTIHVVWTDKLTPKKAQIYYRSSPDTGLTWNAPVALTGTDGNAWNPAIAVNGLNVHVVWREIDTITGHRASWYRHSLDGGATWETPVFLDSTADWPAVAVSGHNVYMANDVVVSPQPNYNTDIFFMRSTDNGVTWSPRQQITSDSGRSEDESIHAEGSRVHMSWNDNRVGKFQILYKESKDFGVTWEPTKVVVPVKDYNTMVWSDSNHVDVVACGAPSGNYQLIIAQSADTGNTWTPSVNLSNDPTHTYFLPDMVRDGDDLHVVCNSAAGPKYFHSGDGGANWDIPDSMPGATFIAYTGCVLHIIYINASKHICYIRNPGGNAGHCDITTGIDHTEETDRVKVFPNPTDNFITVESSKEAGWVSVSNSLGEIIYKQASDAGQIKIDLSDQPAGMYFLSVQGKHAKVIKE